MPSAATQKQKKPQAEVIRNFIQGRWVPAEGGKTFASLSPATGEVLGFAARD